ILWKCGMPFVGDGSQRVIQLIPFRGNTGWEMQFNVLLFVPFGFLLSALMQKDFPRQLLAVVSVSLLMEIAQYAFAVGRSDITDILLNTLGGIIGIGVYYLTAKLFSKHRRILIVIASVFIAVLEVYMSVSFILFGAVWLGFMMFKL
ncbi:VanZ family protein, partial [Eubacteriales bacterium OttesenSCG-928-K08]|nr:VanZ family protein [Eubacteriales bacterium OttesenSCG-928-K08]